MGKNYTRKRGSKNRRNIYNERITYDIKNKSICNTCGKQYDPKNQQNVIQHACKQFQKTKIDDEIKWTPKKEEGGAILNKKEAIWGIYANNLLSQQEEKHTTIQTRKTQEREQSQFRGTIKHISRTRDNQWQCTEPNCKQTCATIAPLLRNSKNEIARPRCGKTSNDLASLLKHLKIRTQNTTWPIAACPIHTDTENYQETWPNIIRYNKHMENEERQNYAQVKIQERQKFTQKRKNDISSQLTQTKKRKRQKIKSPNSTKKTHKSTAQYRNDTNRTNKTHPK